MIIRSEICERELMRSIQEVIDIISRSNYFAHWKEILLNDIAVLHWNELIFDDKADDVYDIFADEFYKNSVPYVIVTEYVDEFFRHLNNHFLDQHTIKNKIAKAYLKNKLKSDNVAIELELSKKLASALETKRNLINAHLRWMQAFISNIINEPVPLELDPTKCHVGQWLLEDNSHSIHQTINPLHKDLHAMAQSALRMYKSEDYAYFLLLYLDILMASYKIRDLIMNLYFSRRLISIFHDPLSQQPNYFQLQEDIKNNEEDYSLLIFNIKEFSKINLLFGHGIGDKLIIEVIDYLKNKEEIINLYRIYGDEFAILFSTALKEKITEIFIYGLSQHEFHVKNSTIVLSFYGSMAKINQHVLERCQYGLMISKAHHGEITNVDEIDEKLFKKYAKNITLAEELRLAFFDNRIIPYFQPILDLKSNAITKYEVLMRIEDLKGNILEPKYFLSVLQGMYIYPEVTKLMIQKSFEVFQNNHYEFSINLSFADIIDYNTQDFIVAMIKNHPETAKRCTFELLENEEIQNYKEVRDFFDLLHLQGVKLALDDFGTGFSNYDTIFQFDIDYIKIDGSLTQSVLKNHKSLVLMESIITVAKELDAKTIVEFVSSEELFNTIKMMDVDYMQGYYIGLPASQLVNSPLKGQ